MSNGPYLLNLPSNSTISRHQNLLNACMYDVLHIWIKNYNDFHDLSCYHLDFDYRSPWLKAMEKRAFVVNNVKYITILMVTEHLKLSFLRLYNEERCSIGLCLLPVGLLLKVTRSNILKILFV